MSNQTIDEPVTKPNWTPLELGQAINRQLEIIDNGVFHDNCACAACIELYRLDMLIDLFDEDECYDATHAAANGINVRR